jgi:hypothetical protein
VGEKQFAFRGRTLHWKQGGDVAEWVKSEQAQLLTGGQKTAPANTQLYSFLIRGLPRN